MDDARDTGSATVAAAAITCAGLSLLMGALLLGQSSAAHAKATSIADLSALRAADTARGLVVGEACAQAEAVAGLNGARLRECTVGTGARTTVDVEVGLPSTGMLEPFGPAVERSRAGAPQDSPFAVRPEEGGGIR